MPLIDDNVKLSTEITQLKYLHCSHVFSVDMYLTLWCPTAWYYDIQGGQGPIHSFPFSSVIFPFQVTPLRARLGFLALATEMKRYISIV